MGDLTNPQHPLTAAALREKYLDKQQMLQIFHISERTLARRRKDGSLPFVRLGGKIYYPVEGVDQAFIGPTRK